MNRDELIAIRLNLLKADLNSKNRNDVCVIAVSKYSDAQDILHAYQGGQRDFGENRVVELTEKSAWLRERGIDDIRWHFIGHLQSNKIQRLLEVPGLHSIHSVDSLKLLEGLYTRLDSFATERLEFFLQVNTSGEEEKGGFSGYDDLSKAANLYLKNVSEKLHLVGLMTMGKIRTEDVEGEARGCFKTLASYKNRLAHDFDLKDLKLSMGMSQDYGVALEEGTDFIRIGSAIFRPEQERGVET